MGAIDGTVNKGKKNKIGVLFVLFYYDEKRVASHLHGGICLAQHTASQLHGYGQCLTLAYISQRLIRRFCCGVRALCSTAAAQSRYELLVVKCSKGTQRMDLL